MLTSKKILTASIFSLIFSSLSIQAQRTLSEDEMIRLRTQHVSSGFLKQVDAMKTIGIECSKSTLQSSLLEGVACRSVVFRKLERNKKVKSKQRLKKKVESAVAALKTAESIAEYSPVVKEPNFATTKTRAHQQTCGVAFDAYDDIRQLKSASLKSYAKELTQNKDFNLFDAACRCAQSTIAIAEGSTLNIEEKSRLQNVITSRKCFLDHDKVYQEKSGQAANFEGNSERFGKSATMNNDTKISGYIKTQELSLKRCRDKVGKTKIKDKKAVEKCVCSASQKWRFPKLDGEGNISYNVNLVPKRVGFDILIGPKGKVKKCGPLTGPLSRR